MATNLKWYGDDVKERAMKAAKKGIDETMAACVIHAKQNHPGFKNITGAAESSIQVTQFAQQRFGSRVFGVWGSVAVNYFIWLELKHGAPLRSAAAVHYPSLSVRIREHFQA